MYCGGIDNNRNLFKAEKIIFYMPILNKELHELNTNFYMYLKRIYSAEYKIDDRIGLRILDAFNVGLDNKSITELKELFLSILDEKIKGSKKETKLTEYERIANLWTEEMNSCLDEITPEGHPLSLAYDNISASIVYRKRSLYLLVYSTICDYYVGNIKNKPRILNNISKELDDIIRKLSQEIYKLGVDVKSMMGIIINESINQAIVSAARIYDLLIRIGIQEEEIIEFDHDETGSIEHDFIFKYENRNYGISAKRTLRERYKQYVNLLQNKDADVLMTITFGTDLTPTKAKTIRGFGVYIFIAPEVYSSNKDLQNIEGVSSIEQFDKETLKKLK